MWDLSIEDGDYKSKFGKQFLVEGYATLDAVDPWRAAYGETIVLSGSGLFPGVKVLYGDTELAVKRWERSGKRAWIVTTTKSIRKWKELNDTNLEPV